MQLVIDINFDMEGMQGPLQLEQLLQGLEYAVTDDDDQFFQTKFAENWPADSQIKTDICMALILAALGGKSRVTEWVHKQPICEVMAANMWGLREWRMRYSWRRKLFILFDTGSKKLLEMPEMVVDLMEATVARRGVNYNLYLGHYEEIKPGVFRRETCLAKNGAVLHAARHPYQIINMIRSYKLSKSDLASVGVPWPWQWPRPKYS